MTDNQFGKKIILLNKNKVCFFANAKSDEFLKKIMTFDILSF